MSIKQQNEINELRKRLEILERKMNVLSPEPRKVAGVEDRDPPRKKPGKPKASIEGAKA